MTDPCRRFRRNPDVAFRVIDGQAVIVVPSTQSMHTLNEVGTFIWQRCEGKTADEIVAEMIDEFEVDEAAAREDLEAFAADLAGKKVLGIE